MKNPWFCFLLILVLLCGCASCMTLPGTVFPERESTSTLLPQVDTLLPHPAGRIVPPSRLFSDAWDDMRPYRAALTPEEFQSLGAATDFPRYRIEIEISPDRQSIRGREEILYTNLTGQALSEVVLRLFPAVMGSDTHISATSVDDKPIPAVVSQEGSVIRIPLQAPLLQAESTVIRLAFAYAMPADPSGNYLIFASTDGILTLAHFYPVLAKYDASGWRTEIPSQNGDILYSDAAFYLVRVIAGADIRLIGSGTVLQAGEKDGIQTVEFACGPARDFYLAADNDLEETSWSSPGLSIRAYGPPGDPDGSRLALETAKRAITIYSQLIGPYPYTEFEIVATQTEALGVEYPGVIAIQASLFHARASGDDSLAREMLESTVAHEVGHQWFYNTVGDDQIREPWLDESLTQYITYRYYLAADGEAAAREFLNSFYNRWNAAGQADIPIGLPVADYSANEYGAIVYGRGPLFFVMLENQLGRDTLDRFLQAYYQDYHWQNATRTDFQVELEAICRCQLEGAFANWVDP